MPRRNLIRWPIRAVAMALVATAALANEPRHLTAQTAITRNEAHSKCAPAIVTSGASCAVGEFGRIADVAGHQFYYARYGFTPEAGNLISRLPYSRVVIFEAASPVMLRPILISSDDAAFEYGTPKVLHSGGRILLHVPAAEDGTGNFNRELLYVWGKDGWRDVDTTNWLDELRRRLPKGLAALKGIFPDYAAMKARTPIWHFASDSNACATAGYADIALGWSADRIVMIGLRLHKSKTALNGEGCFE